GGHQGIGRAGIAEPGARLGDVAGPDGRAADDAALHVRRAEGVDAGARLGWVAAADGGAADGPGGDEVVDGAVVPLPVAALGDIAGASRRAADRRALGIGGTRGARPRTALGRIADARRRPAHGARRRDVVGRAVVAHPVAALRDIARVGRGTADRRALRVRRAARTGSGAALGWIAGPGRTCSSKCSRSRSPRSPLPDRTPRADRGYRRRRRARWPLSV